MKRLKKLVVILTFVIGSSAFAIQPSTNTTNNNTPEAINITKDDFIAKVMNYEKNKTEWVFEGDKPCIIDFYADWCGPCKITGPILEELAKEYKGKINVYKVNVDKERELSQVFGISGIPAFLYCPMKGKPSMTSGIAQDKDQTKLMFKQNIDKILLLKE